MQEARVPYPGRVNLHDMPVSENPLLHINFEIPFDRVRAEHAEPAIAELLSDARSKIEAIAADPAPRTYDNTLLALEKATERLDYAIGVVRHLEGVATYPELRAAFNAVEPLVSEFYSGIPLHAGLWKAIIRALNESQSVKLTPARRSACSPRPSIPSVVTALGNWMKPARSAWEKSRCGRWPKRPPSIRKTCSIRPTRLS